MFEKICEDTSCQFWFSTNSQMWLPIKILSTKSDFIKFSWNTCLVLMLYKLNEELGNMHTRPTNKKCKCWIERLLYLSPSHWGALCSILPGFVGLGSVLHRRWPVFRHLPEVLWTSGPRRPLLLHRYISRFGAHPSLYLFTWGWFSSGTVAVSTVTSPGSPLSVLIGNHH